MLLICEKRELQAENAAKIDERDVHVFFFDQDGKVIIDVEDLHFSRLALILLIVFFFFLYSKECI